MFAEQNLVGDPPFSKLDLICCRNLMMYLRREVQERLLGVFHFALVEHGALFLGSAETIGNQHDLYEPIDKKWRVYRRIGQTSHGRVEFSLTPSAGHWWGGQAGSSTVASDPEDELLTTAKDHLLKDFTPAAVLVDLHHHVRHFYGDTEPYLAQRSGAPTCELLSLRASRCAVACARYCRRVGESGQPVSAACKLQRGETVRSVKITVSPVPTKDAQPEGYLVVFEDQAEAARSNASVTEQSEEDVATANQRLLEQELEETKRDLQDTTEQLESLNEEYKIAHEEALSTNEELQSTNEELQTSKEELESLNEEMRTVNHELAEKIEQLEHSNDDLANLLSSTDIPTLCLDRDLCIRWFTPAATRLMRLRPADKGRPLADLAPVFPGDPLLAEAQQALEQNKPAQKEVDTEQEAWYLRRIAPYRTQQAQVDGVVITFVDITERRKVEMERQRQNEILEQRVIERTASLRLLQHVTSLANETGSLDDALDLSLEHLCAHNDWRLAHVWRYDEQKNELVSAEVWFEDGIHDFSQFKANTSSLRLAPGDGVIGRAFEMREPLWIEDLAAFEDWRRGDPGETEVRACVALPLMHDGRVLRVVEFFADRPRPRDEQFLEVLQCRQRATGIRGRTSATGTATAGPARAGTPTHLPRTARQPGPATGEPAPAHVEPAPQARKRRLGTCPDRRGASDHGRIRRAGRARPVRRPAAHARKRRRPRTGPE